MAVQKAYFAGGCFWCTEAVFQRLKGVESVVPGYTGGSLKNPSYEEVTTGTTGHAETIEITYDPAIISYDRLLDVFFKLHDPTTLNSQGNDRGTQYRSAIFYQTNGEKIASEKKIQQVDSSEMYQGKRVVTTVEKFAEFYPAESYHRDYYNKNSYQPYCSIIIDPKIQKLYKEFPDQLKAKQ